MIRSNLSRVLFAAFACMLASGAAHADKISTQDFYELPNGAKMSQVIAAVGQPNEKQIPPEHLPFITWYYDNVTWHVNGKPCEVRVFFNKHTERLDSIRFPDGVIMKK